MAELLYQGHASFRIISNEGAVLFIDPLMGEGYDRKADVLLVTHEHSDHNHVELVTLKEDGVLIRESDCLKGRGYGSFDHKGFHIQSLPAENRNHPRSQCVGYLIDVDGVRIYHSGDTSYIPEMDHFADLHIDYALLPCDGVYNMDADEMSDCARRIQPRVLIPMHTHVGMAYDKAIADKVHFERRKDVLPGETIHL